MRSKKFITYTVIFYLYIKAALKKFLPVDCIVAGLSSLLVVFFCYWSTGIVAGMGFPSFVADYGCVCSPPNMMIHMALDWWRRSMIFDFQKKSKEKRKKQEGRCWANKKQDWWTSWVGGNRSKERDRKSELVLGSTNQIFEWDRNNSDRNFDFWETNQIAADKIFLKSIKRVSDMSPFPLVPRGSFGPPMFPSC